MNVPKIVEIMGNIDDRFLANALEYEHSRPARTVGFKYLAAAACIALVLSIGAFGASYGKVYVPGHAEMRYKEKRGSSDMYLMCTSSEGGRYVTSGGYDPVTGTVTRCGTTYTVTAGTEIWMRNSVAEQDCGYACLISEPGGTLTDLWEPDGV